MSINHGLPAGLPDNYDVIVVGPGYAGTVAFLWRKLLSKVAIFERRNTRPTFGRLDDAGVLVLVRSTHLSHHGDHVLDSRATQLD